MIRWIPYFLVLINMSSALKVMTFNIWLSGAEVKDGIEKIAKQIREVNPDIVALQEVEAPDVITNITEILGAGWYGVHHCNSTYPDTGIITRHKIIPGTYVHVDYGMHVKIQLEDTKRQVSFWSMHLDYRSYGPYACYNKLVNSEKQILAGEMPTTCTGRVQNMVQLVTNENFTNQIRKSNIVPIIVAGDFNVPSDEDWTEENKAQHGGWAFEWPATKILRDAAGMKDSFRELYPDPVANPGITWSTVNKFQKEWDYTIPEPEDRIDFIFYRGPLRPSSSFPYAGTSPLTPIPHQWDNEWPSDHYAFITEFEDLPTSTEGAVRTKPVDPVYINRHGRDILRIPYPHCEAEIIHGFEEERGGETTPRPRRRNRVHVRARN
ncbi:hypothetical protein PMAYCL1PPCAC_10453 [Pristionchus mayeri]|uniref:Endonuclease/exonuclease/phosphatase domain-containing protein n=1 Tax=Pristionchus mayeri TaxID=1317129 RepID=A0AAN4ZKV6_9BILA|nr:hypothetical protein PMAYCL1PPCAC_10453 [Pristionchus mayeri]